MSGGGEPAERLAALRGAGAWRADPVRFRYLEALARRLQAQPDPVRALLRDKLASAIAEYERTAAAPAPRVTARPQAVVAVTPLAALQARLREAAAARAASASPGEVAPEHELASALRFRQAWQAGRTLAQVDEALQRKPANAGPLNSHALVLHSIALMRELSPAYLRRFLGVVESLQWLEQAGATPPPAGPAKTRRSAKAARPRGRGRSGDI
jgi:hypothetical protein